MNTESLEFPLAKLRPPGENMAQQFGNFGVNSADIRWQLMTIISRTTVQGMEQKNYVLCGSFRAYMRC